MPRNLIVLLAVVLYLAVNPVRSGLTILLATNPTIIGDYAATPIYFENSPTQWNISGELITLAKADTLQDLTNKIVFIPRVKTFQWKDVVLPIQQKGALGIIAQSHNFFSKSVSLR
jgi:hypothetical protein